MKKLVRKTQSVCPVCLKRIPAAIVTARENEYHMLKSCSEHGFYNTVVWRGDNPSYEAWAAGYTPPVEKSGSQPDCPNDCGLCSGHLQKTCCALVEITSRCNLNCPVCFADSGDSASEPSVSDLFEQFKRLADNGNTFVQLSGGEPTVRGDLPEIVSAARRAGCENVQLNSNGIRLAEDGHFVNALRDAGLSFVFMQFDGTNDDIYTKLRGRPLLDIKKAAVKNCSDALLGVTLVPTLVPGVNCDNIGEIIDYAITNSPAVRGVHFQPVSYFGRYPRVPKNKNRLTLPEVLRAIEEQSGGKLSISDFAPSRCDHPYCGFHGDFVVLPKKRLMKLTPKNTSSSCCGDDAHLKNRAFVSRRWTRTTETAGNNDAYTALDTTENSENHSDMDTFLSRIKSHGFTITAMAFQDAYNLDIERLRRCSLHVSDGGRLMPFCARYLSAAEI